MTKKTPTLNQFAHPQIFQNADELRKNMTKAEKMLWEKLRKKRLDGFRFRNQHPISRYVLDFYCFKAKLGIEIDGKHHNDEIQRFYDDDRTENLEELGVKVIRFSNEEVINDLEGVLTRIQRECRERI